MLPLHSTVQTFHETRQTFQQVDIHLRDFLSRIEAIEAAGASNAPAGAKYVLQTAFGPPLTNAYVLTAGANITITPTPGVLTIASTVGTHNLLSSTHPDTAADSAARGAIVVGVGSGPTLWTKLTPTANAQYPRFDGTDTFWETIRSADLGSGAADATSFLRGDRTWQVLNLDSYKIITDGSTPATASGADTFKLRSANSLLTIVTANNDATHGDNALFTVTTPIPITDGGTGQTTALAAFNALSPLTTRGDLLTRDASNNIRLAVGASGRFVRSDGTDPSWSLILDADLGSGTPDSTVFLRGDRTWAAVPTQNVFTTIDCPAGTDPVADSATDTLTLVGTGITITGDSTADSVTLSLTNDAVTFAIMQNIATDRLIGRDTAGTGDPEEISVGGGIEFTGSAGIQTSAFTGDVTKAAGGTALTISNGVVTLAMMANIATDRLIGRDTAGTGVPEALTVSGGIEFTGAGGIQTSAFTGDVTKAAGGTALTIPNDTVTYAKMQNISAVDKILGRKTAGAGDPEEVDFPCTAVLGSLIVGNATPIWTRLAIGSTGQFLRVTGGTAVWSTLADGDIPNTITLDNITQITTRSHASLQNLTADDHSQYLLLTDARGVQNLDSSILFDSTLAGYKFYMGDPGLATYMYSPAIGYISFQTETYIGFGVFGADHMYLIPNQFYFRDVSGTASNDHYFDFGTTLVLKSVMPLSGTHTFKHGTVETLRITLQTLTFEAGATDMVFVFTSGTCQFNFGATNIFTYGTGGITIADAKNIILNTTTGTKFGTSSSQKLSFFNADPIVRPGTSVELFDALGSTNGTGLGLLTAGARNLTMGTNARLTCGTNSTNPPLTLTGQASDPSALSEGLWLNSTQKALCYTTGSSYTARRVSSVICTHAAGSAVASTATETTLLGTTNGTKVIKANDWAVGRIMRVTAIGTFTTKAAPVGDLDLRMSLVGSDTKTPVTINLSSLSASITGPGRWYLDVEITPSSIGASALVLGRSRFTARQSAGYGTTNVLMTDSSDSAVDLTQDRTFAFTADWATSDANNSITCTSCVVEFLN